MLQAKVCERIMHVKKVKKNISKDILYINKIVLTKSVVAWK